jgi:predicted 2-oxoglutarate/Fe(II)-dependent dioxygenase YbiX
MNSHTRAYWTLDDVLTPTECEALRAQVEAAGPTVAPITTSRGFELRPDLRNNTRVMFDDAELAARLYAAVASTLPPGIEGRVPVGANERLRCYRYEAGQYFAPHLDGCFRRDAREASALTLLVYLNDGFEGGATRFTDDEVDVVPRQGRALLFHHLLRHEGAVVRRGVKYALRTDVMYREP